MKRPKFLQKMGNWLAGKQPIKKRGYDAAIVSRLNANWSVAQTSQDTETRGDVQKLRARSRDLERNESYYKKILSLYENNVIGSEGIKLQMQIKDSSGSLDMDANKIVQEAFKKWSLKENCTVSGTMSWLDVQRLALRSTFRDGGLLIRKIRGFDNPFKFSLQLLEIDHLDITYNAILANGNQVRMGVELNKWGKPVAYWIWTTHPGDYYAQSGFKRERVDASEMIHLFKADRAEQTVGVPWGSAMMSKLDQLNGFQEAVLVNARVSAAKMGFFISKFPDGYQGETDAQGNQTVEASPGTFETLPQGTEFQQFDPTQPQDSYAMFVKSNLRGIASACGVDYNSLANDLEGVNYSSIRAGVLETREQYKMDQNWIIESLCDAIFTDWLEMAMLTGEVKLPMTKFDKFDQAKWIPRRWPWVDPLKDMQATQLALSMHVTSPSKVIAEGGGEIEEVYEACAKDKELADSFDLKPDTMGDRTPIEPDPNKQTSTESD